MHKLAFVAEASLIHICYLLDVSKNQFVRMTFIISVSLQLHNVC